MTSGHALAMDIVGKKDLTNAIALNKAMVLLSLASNFSGSSAISKSISTTMLKSTMSIFMVSIAI